MTKVEFIKQFNNLRRTNKGKWFAMDVIIDGNISIKLKAFLTPGYKES